MFRCFGQRARELFGQSHVCRPLVSKLLRHFLARCVGEREKGSVAARHIALFPFVLGRPIKQSASLARAKQLRPHESLAHSQNLCSAGSTMVLSSILKRLPVGQRMKVFLGTSLVMTAAYMPMRKKENIQHENMEELREFKRAQEEKAAAAAAATNR